MNRSFVDKLKNPDEDFIWYLRMLSHIVPLGIGFLIILVLLLSLLFIKLAGTDAPATRAIYWLTSPLSYLILSAILIPYVVLKVLQLYVSAKIKKRSSQKV
jgi:hypothetical protein